MSGHRPFSDIKKGWSPERLAANEAGKAQLAAEMISLEHLREGLGISQEELASRDRDSLRGERLRHRERAAGRAEDLDDDTLDAIAAVEPAAECAAPETWLGAA